MDPNPLLEQLPAKDPSTALPVMRQLVKGGPATVAELVNGVGERFGNPDGVKPTYALHGLVHYASRPDADAERKMVAETLAEQLAAKKSTDLKAFLCQQLQLCGGTAEVPALAGVLEDDTLCEPATQALTGIGGEAAAAALRAALPAARGKRRVTLVNALGRFRDKAAAAEVRKSVEDQDPDLRIVARYALGNMGDLASAGALLKVAEGEPNYERAQAFDACLRLARRLGESGKADEAEKILRPLAAKRTAAEEVHDRLAVLECLGAVLGAKAVSDMLAALASTNLKYRVAAARFALDLAVRLQKTDPAEAAKLAAAILDSTKEEAVRQQAQALLARSGK
jgi:hypothetical protein